MATREAPLMSHLVAWVGGSGGCIQAPQEEKLTGKCLLEGG